jgi:acetyl esterase/lipase
MIPRAAAPFLALLLAALPPAATDGTRVAYTVRTRHQTFHRALSDVGCEVEFLAYPRDPPGFQEPAHRVHMLSAWATWFDQHGRK